MCISADLVVSLCLLSRVESNIAELTVQWFTEFPKPQRVLLLLRAQRRALVLGLLTSGGCLTHKRTRNEAGHCGRDDGRWWGPWGHLWWVGAWSRWGRQGAGREGELAGSRCYYRWGNQCMGRVQRWRPQWLCEVHGWRHRHCCLCVIHRWGSQGVCHRWKPQWLSWCHWRGAKAMWWGNGGRP